jgi:hypothetical protein
VGAAGALIPAKRRSGLGNKWLEELWCCMRKGAVHSRGHRTSRDEELTVRPLMAGAAALGPAAEPAPARKKRRWPYICGRALGRGHDPRLHRGRGMDSGRAVTQWRKAVGLAGEWGFAAWHRPRTCSRHAQGRPGAAPRPSDLGHLRRARTTGTTVSRRGIG